MVITWEPRSRGVSAPQVVAVKARTTDGDGAVRRPARAGRLRFVVPSDSARFDVPTGRVEIDMTIYDGEGKTIDTDARDFDVPDLRSQKRGPVLLAPEVVRARTLRDFQTAATDPDAAPSSVRTFARGDRLLIRVPAFDASGTAVQVTAKVLNGWGQPMRDIDPLDADAARRHAAVRAAALVAGARRLSDRVDGHERERRRQGAGRIHGDRLSG